MFINDIIYITHWVKTMPLAGPPHKKMSRDATEPREGIVVAFEKKRGGFQR